MDDNDSLSFTDVGPAGGNSSSKPPSHRDRDLSQMGWSACLFFDVLVAQKMMSPVTNPN